MTEPLYRLNFCSGPHNHSTSHILHTPDEETRKLAELKFSELDKKGQENAVFHFWRSNILLDPGMCVCAYCRNHVFEYPGVRVRVRVRVRNWYPVWVCGCVCQT